MRITQAVRIFNFLIFLVKNVDKAKKVLFQGKLRNQFMNEGVNPDQDFDEIEEEDEKKQNILNTESLLFQNEKNDLNLKRIIERKKIKGKDYTLLLH